MNAGYLPGLYLHQHDSGLLCAFVHAVGRGGLNLPNTLYLSLLQNGTTALCQASQADRVEVVRLLLESGALVNEV